MVTDVILRRHNATPPGCHQDKVLWDVRGTPGSTRNLRERFPCADDLAFQMPDVRRRITSSSGGWLSYCPGGEEINNKRTERAR